MSYLILGIAVLCGALLAGQWFVSANPKSIIKVSKWLLFGIIGLVILFFVLSGRFALALWTIPVLIPWLLRARAARRAFKNYSTMASGGTSGNSSEVTSVYLTMRLDHDSGDMDGTIRAGTFEGRHLSDLSADDLIELYRTYVDADIESARLLGAFLDRYHPDWRGGAADDDYDEDAGSTSHQSQMDRAEALRILGLEEGANEEDIKAAHHRLIAGLHPDRGGSAYLSAKINEARDVLLRG